VIGLGSFKAPRLFLTSLYSKGGGGSFTRSSQAALHVELQTSRNGCAGVGGWSTQSWIEFPLALTSAMLIPGLTRRESRCGVTLLCFPSFPDRKSSETFPRAFAPGQVLGS